MSDTREHILTTAFELFFEKGYKSVTMNELVAASGMSKGAFYHYFTSKEEVYDLTLEKFFNLYLEQQKLDFDDSLTLKENIKGLLQRFAPLMERMNTSSDRSAEFLGNYLVFLQSLMKKKKFRAKMGQYNKQYIREFEQWIREAQQRGELKKELNATVLAQHLTYLMKGNAIFYALVDQDEPMHISFNKVIDQFFSQIEC
jgi:AcrR family transcriptional regulator